MPAGEALHGKLTITQDTVQPFAIAERNMKAGQQLLTADDRFFFPGFTLRCCEGRLF